jgi:hypothetical protein
MASSRRQIVRYAHSTTQSRLRACQGTRARGTSGHIYLGFHVRSRVKRR